MSKGARVILWFDKRLEEPATAMFGGVGLTTLRGLLGLELWTVPVSAYNCSMKADLFGLSILSSSCTSQLHETSGA